MYAANKIHKQNIVTRMDLNNVDQHALQTCKFGFDRSIIEGNLLRDYCALSALSWLPLKEFS